MTLRLASGTAIGTIGGAVLIGSNLVFEKPRGTSSEVSHMRTSASINAQTSRI
jgi:hypothetical protein